MTQFDQRNLSMMMDFYEMTMANGYYHNEREPRRVVFDVFARKNPDGGGFAIFAGLQQIVEYIEHLHFGEDDLDYLRRQKLFRDDFLRYLADFRFTGDLYAFPEGTVMYPNEPVLTVVAPLIDAQLVETAILTQVNHQSLIATKTSRIVRAAGGRAVSDFGARRAHNMDAAIYGARAAFIGGAVGTATVSAGQMFGIPVGGTMAHSWVMYYGDEFDAFKRYALTYPDNVVLLLDTYDVLRSGVPNAIRVAREVLAPLGKRLKGVRLDSGDLAYLSKRVRCMLNEAGLADCKITVSNALDEYTITSILQQGGCIDNFGVGERLITGESDPVFGAVYKLAAVEDSAGSFVPRMKISETVEKITNPGRKQVYRIYDADGNAVADMLAKYEEPVDLATPFRFVDPEQPWRVRHFEGFTAKPLQRLVVKGGRRVDGVLPPLAEIQAHVRRQLAGEIWAEEQRFENPHRHYIDMTPDYYEMKMDLLNELGNRVG